MELNLPILPLVGFENFSATRRIEVGRCPGRIRDIQCPLTRMVDLRECKRHPGKIFAFKFDPKVGANQIQ